MSATYDGWKTTEPSDPWADEQERLEREAEDDRAENPDAYEDLYQCDGCGKIKPSDEIRTMVAYGCEGDFCAACRGVEP